MQTIVVVDSALSNRYNKNIKWARIPVRDLLQTEENSMSSFQDLYAHAAADRDRAIQYRVIQDIRRRAVREMLEDDVYIEPENADSMTEEELTAHRTEGAYAYGLRSILEVRVQPEEDGNPAYATAVRNTATKPNCIALCLQTKLEELTMTNAIPEGTEPVFHVVAANDDANETIQPLVEAIDLLRAAYPAWRFTIESRSEETAARAEIAKELRATMKAAQEDPDPETTQKLMMLISAAQLVFPAQRPAGAPAEAADGSGVHLQFGKVRTRDNKTYFMAFSDHAKFAEWKRMSYVELSLQDYAPLILNSRDDGLIIDPNVGASLVLTRDHIKTLQERVENFNNMIETLSQFMPDREEKDELSQSIDELLSMPPEEKKKKGRNGKKKKK